MSKTILYFHGFASSSDSNKAKIISSYISKISSNTKIIIPDLNNNFQKAISQIELLIKNNDKPIFYKLRIPLTFTIVVCLILIQL